jgi:O-antigen ligase
LSEPLGQGLGNVGSAAIAGASGSTMTLDNGYLSRLVELGVLGFVAYLVTLAIAFFAAWYAFRMSVTLENRESSLPSILAVSLALQVMLLWIDLSTDSHTGILGIFFWYSIYNVSVYGLAVRERALIEGKPSFSKRAAAT